MLEFLVVMKKKYNSYQIELIQFFLIKKNLTNNFKILLILLNKNHQMIIKKLFQEMNVNKSMNSQNQLWMKFIMSNLINILKLIINILILKKNIFKV